MRWCEGAMHVALACAWLAARRGLLDVLRHESSFLLPTSIMDFLMSLPMDGKGCVFAR